MSCLWAPLTTRDSGIPRASPRRLRFVPFFSPVRWVRPNRFRCQRGLYHGPVDALPGPCNPFISSYSAKPLRQSFTNTPFLFHSKKYLCTELALPYSSFGNAFHWHPVRKTKTMAASTFRGSMAFRPAPARRKYFRLLSRLGFGMSGSARSQNSSDIVHDLKAFMAYNVIQTTAESNNLFTDKYLVYWFWTFAPKRQASFAGSIGETVDPPWNLES